MVHCFCIFQGYLCQGLEQKVGDQTLEAMCFNKKVQCWTFVFLNETEAGSQ